MIRSFLVVASLVAAATAVVAQTDPITERKQIMRNNGAATRVGTQMIRNEVPFDVAKAREVFAGIVAGMDRFPTLFPEGTQAGAAPQTRAAPAIWTDSAGFRAASAKIVQDSQQAAASTTDLATFQANFQRVTANCNSCHEKYRTAQ
jgi:cytochrome c556